MKKLILYDLDGTLADTRQDIINGVRYALEMVKGPDLTDDEIKDCVGTGRAFGGGICYRVKGSPFAGG